MVLGWRRAFCTSIGHQDDEHKKKESTIIKDKSDPTPSPRLTARFGGFFSTPSTPRMRSSTQPVVVSSPTLRCRTTTTPAAASNSPPVTPKLQCITRNSPRFFNCSAPSSPRSPSTFSFLKSSLRLSNKSRCGICLESVKAGQGTAIFTAECGHSFHFPCVAAHVKKQGSLTCPICNSTWKELHLLNSTTTTDHIHHNKKNEAIARDSNGGSKDKRLCVLKVYNDDEPLSSPTSGARFNPIPESDETDEENQDFPGFFATNNGGVDPTDQIRRGNMIEMALLSEVAVVSVGKTSETYAVVLKLKAPAAASNRRAPIDLVTVLNVSSSVTSDKLHLMKKMMRMVVSSLSAADRLSIVAFSSTSKRVLPLRRMTTAGRRSARRVIDAIVSLNGAAAASATDSIKKAAKVIEDRRERNLAASILIFSDGHRSGPLVTSTRFSQSGIPLHSVSLSASLNAPPDDTLSKCVTGLLSEVIQDLKIQLGFAPGSSPAEISAVYSYTGKPAFLGSGSSWCRGGDFHSSEERELLIELKVPLGEAHRVLTVRCSYKDPSTQQPIYDKERPLLIPRPRSVGSSTRDIQRLRCLFVTTRAVAESRRMMERNELAAAHYMLASARALVLQSGTGSGEEFVRGLEAELAELNWKRDDQTQVPRRGNNHQREATTTTKAEPLTPTSAWRAAERLAKVAIMRKSLNRVSDLHGFENARF